MTAAVAARLAPAYKPHYLLMALVPCSIPSPPCCLPLTWLADWQRRGVKLGLAS
jgi:hypothetical protein